MNDNIKYCSNPICSEEIKGFGNNPQRFLNLKPTRYLPFIHDLFCKQC